MKYHALGLALAALLLISSLSACGNKGPLYLPAPADTSSPEKIEKAD